MYIKERRKIMTKTSSYFFNELYVGTTKVFDLKNYKLNTIEIACILDDNCVRFTRSVNGKKAYTKEFENNEKQKCLTMATKMYEKYLNM